MARVIGMFLPMALLLVFSNPVKAWVRKKSLEDRNECLPYRSVVRLMGGRLIMGTPSPHHFLLKTTAKRTTQMTNLFVVINENKRNGDCGYGHGWGRFGFGFGKNVAETKKLSMSRSCHTIGRMLSGGGGNGDEFRWTLVKVVQALVLFVLAGIAEIGGGWLVWMSVRERKPWWWAFAGSLLLVLYGFIPTLQPTASFGRIYAVYGGFFIALSYVWGWILDGMKPDTGDIVGGTLALAAVLVILFWPRKQ